MTFVTHVALVTGATAILSGTVAASLQAAQEQKRSFEVASVKRNLSGRQDSTIATTPETFRVVNYELRYIIARAFQIPLSLLQSRLIGGDSRLLSARFDISAKAPGPTASDDVAEMLRHLLMERFGLKINAEVRDTAVYELTVRRHNEFGPALRRSNHNCEEIRARLRIERRVPADGIPPPVDAENRPLCWQTPGLEPWRQGAWVTRSAGHIEALVASIQGFVDRPILDRTGLEGNFEWQLEFHPLSIPPADSSVPSLFTAVQEQLGLVLSPSRSPFEVLVIDSIAEPTED